jgi:hypothetical protein
LILSPARLLGHPLMIAGNPKHHLPRWRVVHLLRQLARRFRAVAPGPGRR